MIFALVLVGISKEQIFPDALSPESEGSVGTSSRE